MMKTQSAPAQAGARSLPAALVLLRMRAFFELNVKGGEHGR